MIIWIVIAAILFLDLLLGLLNYAQSNDTQTSKIKFSSDDGDEWNIVFNDSKKNGGRMVINGKTVRCDMCNRNANHITNNKIRCDEHH